MFPHSQILRRGTPLAFLSLVDMTDDFNQAALRGDHNRNTEYLSAIHTTSLDATISTPSLEEMITLLKNTGLQLDQAKQNLTADQFRELINLLYELIEKKLLKSLK